MSKVIEIENLSKDFRQRQSFFGQKERVLNNLSLVVNEGEVYALLGANGSGKTTVLNIILNIIPATSGRVILFENRYDFYQLRQKLGFQPEIPYVWPFLTAEEYLSLIGQLFISGQKEIKKRVIKALDTVRLRNSLRKTIHNFSKGMLKKLTLAQALLNEPELLILDEPLDGLDPEGIYFFREFMKEQRERRKTILFTSHLLAEIESFTDTIGILVKGGVKEEKITNLGQGRNVLDLYMSIAGDKMK